MRTIYTEYSDDLKLLSVIEDSILDEIGLNYKAEITANNYNGLIVIGGEINCDKNFNINSIAAGVCERLNIKEGPISMDSVRTIDLISQSDVYEGIFVSYGYSSDYNEKLIPEHEFIVKNIINYHKGKTIKVSISIENNKVEMIGIETPDQTILDERAYLVDKLDLKEYYLTFRKTDIKRVKTNPLSGSLSYKRFGDYLCREIANHITKSTYAKKCQISILYDNGEHLLNIDTFGTEIVNIETIWNRVMDQFDIDIIKYKKNFKGKLVDTNFNDYEVLPYEITDKLKDFTMV